MLQPRQKDAGSIFKKEEKRKEKRKEKKEEEKKERHG